MYRELGLSIISFVLVICSYVLLLHIKTLRSLDRRSEGYTHKRNDCLFMVFVTLGLILVMAAMLVDTIYPTIIPIELGF